MGQFFLFIQNYLIITTLDSSGRVSLDKTGACMVVVCTLVSSRLLLLCDMEWKSRRVCIIVLCLLYSLRRHDRLYPQTKYRYPYHLQQFYLNGGAKKPSPRVCRKKFQEGESRTHQQVNHLQARLDERGRDALGPRAQAFLK